MKEIIIGTKNPAKVEQIKGALSPISELVVVGLHNENDLPEVEEEGPTAQDNARLKAITYAKILGKPVLSMDNALYFDDLEGDDRQPGLNVRRFAGEGPRPSDEEMIEYYSRLVKELGGKTKGRWEFAICVATPEGIYEETTIISPRVFTSIPSEQISEGYPLESLQKDPETDTYISEMNEEDVAQFWNKMIGSPLQEFVSSLNY